jgi:hypothetical protein
MDTQSGRLPDGRFAKGNKAGKGNPRHREVVALREAFPRGGAKAKQWQ